MPVQFAQTLGDSDVTLGPEQREQNHVSDGARARQDHREPVDADSFAACEALVRDADYDRYLSALFAPAERRRHLFALYAFNYEVATKAAFTCEIHLRNFTIAHLGLLALALRDLELQRVGDSLLESARRAKLVVRFLGRIRR